MLRTQVAGDWAAWSPTGTGRGERRVQANESAGSAACGRAQRRQDGAAPPSCAGRWEEAPHGDSGGRPSGPRPEATQPRLSPHVPRASRVAAPTPEHWVSVLLRGRLALWLSSSLAAVPAGFHSRACGDFWTWHWTPGWGPRCGAGPLAPPPVTGTPGRGLACSGRRSCRAQVASSACPAAGLSRRPQAVLGDGGLVLISRWSWGEVTPWSPAPPSCASFKSEVFVRRGRRVCHRSCVALEASSKVGATSKQMLSAEPVASRRLSLWSTSFSTTEISFIP